jgi:heterodisulfide reductase subunit B
MNYAFYPGCAMEGTGRDYRQSTLAVARVLGLELPEVPDWVCCGSTAAHAHDPLLAAALPAQSLRSAAAMPAQPGSGPRKVAVACAACFNRLRLANRQIAADPLLRARVAEAIGGDYDGQVPVLHLLEILARDIGTSAIAAKVRHRLAGLKVVCYYGCLLARPAEVAFDDVENPTLMDQLIRATGAEALDWPHKTECCGASASVTNPEIVLRLGGQILAMAQDAGADAVVTACPLCQLNLDLRQKDIEAREHRTLGLPVFYFTQVLGLALGCSLAELGLASLVVDPRPVLARVGFGEATL